MLTDAAALECRRSPCSFASTPRASACRWRLVCVCLAATLDKGPRIQRPSERHRHSASDHWSLSAMLLTVQRTKRPQPKRYARGGPGRAALLTLSEAVASCGLRTG